MPPSLLGPGKFTAPTSNSAQVNHGPAPSANRPTGVGLAQSADGERCYYAIGHAVGPGGRNQRTDVMLVQYFLREIFARDSFFQQKPFAGGPLGVDGWIGPQTCKAILHFQTVLKSNGRSIVTDGRVDSAHNTSIFTLTPTIYWLNVYFKEARSSDWPRVSQAGDCPDELRPLLVEPPAPPFI